MKISLCPSCGGRLVAHINEDSVKVKCNACGQELGTFSRADRPVIINDGPKIYPALDSDGTEAAHD